MTKKYKITGIGKKIIPATAALGILFSMAPIAENKASAGIGVVVDVGITSLGIIKDIYEALGISPEGPDPGTHIDGYAENITYRAPNFTSGEFNISMHHTKDDSNFTKSVKVLYPNGKIKIYKLRSGQQLKITEAGTIIDLNPDANSVSEHDLLYITQAQLDEGKTGIAMNQGRTAFLEKASGKNARLVLELHEKNHKQNSKWEFARGTDALFAELSEEEKQLSTLTSKPVSKEVLENYVNNDTTALADFHDRSASMFADTNLIFKTPIVVSYVGLENDTPFQIIPCEKGSKKVILKTGSKYLSGKEGESLQYSDSIGDNEIFELVQIENNTNNEFQFDLINKNGAYLAYAGQSKIFSTNTKDHIRFIGKSNNEIHNWLREWYPGKENEKQKYDGIQIVADEKDPTKKTAKDSSGNVIKNSWVTVSDVHYYAGSDGFLLKGWQEIEGKTYYFKDDSSMLKENSWDTPINNKFYNFDDNGALQRSAWTSHSERYSAYSDASGAFVEEGLREIDGKIYYFESRAGSLKKEVRLEDQDIVLHFSGDKGALEKASRLDGGELKGYSGNDGAYVTFDKKDLFFEKDGLIRKSGASKGYAILAGENKPVLNYYSLEEGLSYSGWKEIDGKKYHFQWGRHTTFDGHEEIDGKRYYFNQDGEAKLTGFDKVDGKIYYYNDKGEMQTGWQQINDKWYYFDASGAVKIGWFQGSYETTGHGFGYFTYYAKADGSIYQDVTVEIDGKNHKFDSHGHKE